jgi:predicted permease
MRYDAVTTGTHDARRRLKERALMLQDLRFAIRSLVRSRGFAAATVTTLALGIGANTVVYSVLDAMMLRPLPFGDRTDRLVTLHSTHPTQATDWDDSELSYPDLIDLRERAQRFEAVEGLIRRNVSAEAGERVQAASITPGMFRMLGVEPQRGRAFTDDEAAEPGQESHVIISDALWRRLFGGDGAIVGRGMLVNGRSLTIVGVMPPGFGFPERHEIWLPLRMSRDVGRDRRSIMAIGLLREGTTLDEARAEVRTLAATLAERYPGTNRDWGVHAMFLRDFFVRPGTRRALTAMLAAVGLVLLVACANVASLLVARGVGRQRELTVRAALGSGRGRLVRLLLLESAVLSVLGGAVGLLVASWGLDALLASMPEPPPHWAQLRLDGRVLTFTAGISALTALACGLLPALRLTRLGAPHASLHAARSGGQSPDQRRLQGTLVAGQVAVSLALLVCATLLARSAMQLQHADVGFDPRPLLSLRVYLAGDAYNDQAARARGLRRIATRLQALPGVSSTAATGAIPSDDGGDAIRLVPEHATASRTEEIGAQLIPITPAFFDTIGARLLDGRTFTDGEHDSVDADVIVVNRALAARFWPGEPAIGRRLLVATGSGVQACRVIGVAPDLVYEELGEETAQSKLNVYVPYGRAGWRTMAVLLQTAGDPSTVAPSVRAAIREIDPAVAPFDMQTMIERRRATSWGERFIGNMFAGFGLAALLLACVGAYGLTAYSAAQRTREIGVRMAVGAGRVDILRLLIGRGARLALIGIVVGAPLASAAAGGVQRLLFRVSPWDPAVWAAMPIALVAAVLLASYAPAHRASRIDPATALKQE